MDRELLKQNLIRDEGVSLKSYTCPAGRVSIGVGRNMQDLGITRDEALLLLDHDIDRISKEIAASYAWISDTPEAVQRGFFNLFFNIGQTRVGGFKKMLAALEARDWERAAQELVQSQYSIQVGARAQRIASLFRGPHV